MRNWIKRLAVLFVILFAGVAGVAYYLLSQPYGTFGKPLFVEIERGSGTRRIAKQLAENGVIEHEWAFLLQRALRPKAVLQAGEYQFSQAASVTEVFDRLINGDIYFFDVTIPEGSNIWEIARILEMEGIFSEEEFLKAAADPAPIQDLDPMADSLEGYLFPSTYRLSHSTSAAELCRMMVEEFKKRWSELKGATRVREAVTLASLVEKETGVDEERPLVAGVFANRLEIGMPLGCDPTVIYAARLAGKYRGAIYRSDLDRDHPYNTYKRTGLPPGPIANPGLASLRAAIDPAETKFLFFVAKASGPGHVFSATAAEHNRAVRSYRARQQEN